MPIYYRMPTEANGNVCQMVDEFDNHRAYTIDCSEIGTATMRATPPSQNWIDLALRIYFEYSLEKEAQANADALEMELQDYYLMYPEYDPSLGSFSTNQEQYVIDNQPTTPEEIDALIALVRNDDIWV
ncbi:hypothetical protein [Nostoc sp. UHCC 0252]|uniref:hypothetical protein n=1 Tax=Nostoc sp. UHCC 0252 TaxID=3110241 RepID=UPI002B1F32DE|nr:hypothetical protein [Nostoc sp. UHCC 0252]MEA5603722.1 hypothetical protein [Nostoc sp. UHCC 0252]